MTVSRNFSLFAAVLVALLFAACLAAGAGSTGHSTASGSVRVAVAPPSNDGSGGSGNTTWE